MSFEMERLLKWRAAPQNYRTIESFQEYVLIEQYRPHVEHYVKQGDTEWLFRDYSGLQSSFTLSSVKVEIALADLYEATTLV